MLIKQFGFVYQTMIQHKIKFMDNYYYHYVLFSCIPKGYNNTWQNSRQVIFITSAIGEIVIPENCRPLDGLHSQVAFITMFPGVQQIHIILYQWLENTHIHAHNYWLLLVQKSCFWHCKDVLFNRTHRFFISPIICHWKGSLPSFFYITKVKQNRDVPAKNTNTMNLRGGGTYVI